MKNHGILHHPLFFTGDTVVTFSGEKGTVIETFEYGSIILVDWYQSGMRYTPVSQVRFN